jgi:hypothetical protein
MDFHPTTVSNSGVPNNQATVKLSFSTADVEKQVFYGEQLIGPRKESTGKVVLVVVHGVAHPLVDSAPEGSIPFSEESGLMRLTE